MNAELVRDIAREVLGEISGKPLSVKEEWWFKQEGREEKVGRDKVDKEVYVEEGKSSGDG